jgi:hypothetical protein
VRCDSGKTWIDLECSSTKVSCQTRGGRKEEGEKTYHIYAGEGIEYGFEVVPLG